MPKVSICIPTYNQVQYLRRTLESVLQQTFEDFEIIITDDSTTNDVQHLISEFRHEFGNKLLYKRNAPSLGSPANWNEAISLAKGEYIKILHHDEWFSTNDALLKFVGALDNNANCDFAFSQAIALQVSENKTWIHKASKKRLNVLMKQPMLLQLGNFIGSPSNIIFRNATVKYFDSNLKWLVDVEFYIRLLLNNANHAWIDEPLITSVTGAEHNVTNDCIGNPYVQISEHLYTYDLYSAHLNTVSRIKYFVHFIKLFKAFKVKGNEDLKKYGYQRSPDVLVKWALKFV
jgi:glycosyltransferase involved in cell wall biosynthesis